jgi:tyrosine phenol-lyase
MVQPFKAKIVNFPKKLDYQEKLIIAKEYFYNVNNIPNDYLFTDLANLSINALSEEQYAALFLGDEAYAGAENFINIKNAVKSIFNKDYVIPTHNFIGLLHLLVKILYHSFNIKTIFTTYQNYYLNKLATYLNIEYKVFDIDSFIDFINKVENNKNVDKFLFFEISNLFKGINNYDQFNILVEKLSFIKKQGFKLIADFSSIFSSLYLLMKRLYNTVDYRDYKQKIIDLSSIFDLILMDAEYDIIANTGAIIFTNDFSLYELLTQYLVSFEGLHTYGGLAGREMELIYIGLLQAYNFELNYNIYDYKYQEIKYLYDNIKKLGYKVSDLHNIHYFYIEIENPYSFNLLLFLSSQCRGLAVDNKLYFFLPSRRYQKSNYDLVIKALKELYIYKDKEYLKLVDISELSKDYSKLDYSIDFQVLQFDLIMGKNLPKVLEIDPLDFVVYNFNGIEIITNKDREYRLVKLEEAGYNTFLLDSKDVFIDLLTDSGTSAQSDDQFSAAIKYQSNSAYSLLKDSIYEIFGFDYFIPTHQGRAAEHILSQTLIKKGQYVINNMYFTTTRFHQEYAGGIFVDLIVDDAYKPKSDNPFKGNLDIQKTREFVEKNYDKIAYICIENNVNMAGGQPVSMENIRKVKEICEEYNIPLVLDATRIAENAFFIKEREEGYQNKTIKEIIREMMSYIDAATISAKKDPLTNISGLILVRNHKWYNYMRQLTTLFEGSYFNGGLNNRDLAMLAFGLKEMTNYHYLKQRIEQVRYLGKLLKEKGIPIVEPIGGHAIYLDAKEFLNHIIQDNYPAQALAAYIYLYGGVRTMERGIVSAGRDPITKENRHPELELVRITIPRRVYTNEHMEYVADVIYQVYKDREKLNGLEIVYEPPFLRFFTAKFKPIKTPKTTTI